MAIALRPRHWLALGLIVVASPAALAAPAHAAQRRVLLVTEARGFIHPSIADAAAFFASLGDRSSRYDVTPLDGAAGLTRRRLRRADAVVFANTTGELPLPDRRAFLRFVHRGGAFVGTHSASDTLHSWRAYARLLGGEFSRHGIVQPGRMVVARRPHPVTRGMPRSFAITDEFYEFTAPPAKRTRVLIRLDPDSVSDEVGQSLPLVWARRYGNGRVVYDALGHRPETWAQPLFSRILRRGLAWALGR